MRDVKSGLTSIISLNWSHYDDLTGPFIRYVDVWTPEDKELIIVDQGSKESDRDKLVEDARRYPWLKVVLLEENVGFPAGNNVGLEVVEGEYIIAMNNDVIINAPWLAAILEELRADRRAIVGASLIQKGGWNEFEEGGRYVHVPYLEGWLLAMHRSVVEELELFDERFGIGGMEDVEFCWRAVKAGYRLVQIPNLPIVHLRGRTVTDGRIDQDSITAANHELLKKWVLRGEG